jgi:hypothetical protein
MHGLKYKVAYDYFIALVTAHPPKGKWAHPSFKASCRLSEVLGTLGFLFSFSSRGKITHHWTHTYDQLLTHFLFILSIFMAMAVQSRVFTMLFWTPVAQNPINKKEKEDELFKSQIVWKISTKPSTAWNPYFSHFLFILNNLKSYECTN